MALDVIIDFGLECLDQRPPCTLARNLVQSQQLLARFPFIPLLDYLKDLVASPFQPGCYWAVAFLLTQKDTSPFSCTHQIHSFR